MPLLTDVDGVRAWAEGKHDGGAGLIGALGDRYPLVIFHGDIGTGKTAPPRPPPTRSHACSTSRGIY